MKRLFVVLGLLGNIIVLVDTGAVGGLRLRINKSGLNKVIYYLLETNLIPFLQEYDGDDLALNEAALDLTILVNKMKFQGLQGQYGYIKLPGENRVGIIAGFQSFQVSANVTLKYSDGGSSEYGPDTTLTVADSKLELIASLGTSQNSASVDIQSCKAAIGKITAGGELRYTLQGILNLASGKASELIEQLCPYLEEQANEYLGNILSLQLNTTVGSPRGDIGLTFQMTFAGADEDNIRVITAVSLEGETRSSYGSDDVSFPDNDHSEVSKEVDLSMNKFLLNQLLHKGIDTAAILRTTLENIKGFSDGIEITVSSVADKAVVSTNGVSLDGSTNITFLSQKDKSKLFQTSLMLAFYGPSWWRKPKYSEMGGHYMYSPTFHRWGQTWDSRGEKQNGVVPMTLSSSEKELRAVPDTKRTQLFFKITDEVSDSIDGADMKELQWTILTAYEDKIDNLLKDHFVRLGMPNTDKYGLKNILIQTSKDILCVSTDLRVGHLPPSSDPTIRHHDQYHGKRLEVTFSDGDKRVRKTVVTSGASDVVICFATLAAVICLHISGN